MEIILKNINIDLANKKSTVEYSDGSPVYKRIIIEDKDKIQTNDVLTQEASTEFSDIFNGSSFQESAKSIIDYLQNLKT